MIRHADLSMDLTLNDFTKLIKAEAELMMKAINSYNQEYQLTKDVTDTIKTIWEFSKQKHPRKGIALVGKIGCGKSLLLKAYVKAHNRYTKEVGRVETYKYTTAKDLAKKLTEITDVGYSNLLRSPLLIDELGRESKEAVIYGTRTTPTTDFILERYDRNSLTLITANIGLETLSSESGYGAVVGDRLKEMLHFVEMKGDSKR